MQHITHPASLIVGPRICDRGLDYARCQACFSVLYVVDPLHGIKIHEVSVVDEGTDCSSIRAGESM